jgi:hypothetical protein
MTSVTAVVQGTLLQAAEDKTEVSAKLLKKAVDSDAEMVSRLLPQPGAMLDIRA